MTAFYNEHDPFAAAWLRELIARDLIAPGVVDERSIVEIEARELADYDQCHFFAGIGVWSYALRCAGWADDRRVWTGSCPCQPFSAAGKGEGTADERHLWPAWFRLIEECRSDTIFGEQVSGRGGETWLDYVRSDLDRADYVTGVLSLPACGFGAPHIRARLFFVAHSDVNGRSTRTAEPRWEARGFASGTDGRMAQSQDERLQGRRDRRERIATRPGELLPRGSSLDADALGDSEGIGRQRRPNDYDRRRGQRAPGHPGPVNGFWRDAEWIACRDGKARPVEPGTSPLAHGAPARVGRLRGYGNAIVAPVAEAFVRAYMDLCDSRRGAAPVEG